LALAAIVTLAVGITLSAATFALVDPFLSRPLPYAAPDRLALIELQIRDTHGPHATDPFPDLREWQRRTDLFEGLAAFHERPPLRVERGTDALELNAAEVSSNLLAVLARAPVHADARAGVTPGDVWLTPHAWQGPMRDAAVGSLVRHPDGVSTIRGLVPGPFLFPEPDRVEPLDALVVRPPGPVARVERRPDFLTWEELTLVARLAPSATPSTVKAALDAAANGRLAVRVTPLDVAMKRDHRPLARGAMAAGVLVLLVCLANAAGLGLTRGLYRGRQLGVMESLGASAAMVVRLLLAESAIVGLCATAAAMGAMPLVIHGIRARVPEALLPFGLPMFDVRGATFVLVAGTLGTGAWWLGSLFAWRRRQRSSLRESASGDGGRARVLRFAVVGVQAALTFVLLGTGFLFARSYLHIVFQDAGMDREVFALSVSYEPTLQGAALAEVIDDTVQSLARVPGVQAAAASVGQMADDFNVMQLMVVAGRPFPIDVIRVTDDYFDATGMSFVRGHSFNPGDDGVVVNDVLAQRLLGPNTQPGDTVRVGGHPAPLVGIVHDSRRQTLDRPAKPTAFLPLTRGNGLTPSRVTYTLHTRTAGHVALDQWTRRIRDEADNVAVLDASTLGQRLLRTVQDKGFATLVVVLFGAATVLTTLVSLAVIVAYVVASRTSEIAIRVAVGAQPRSMIWLVMRDVAWASVSGTVVGLVVSVLFGQVVRALLFDGPSDIRGALLCLAAVVSAISLATAAFAARRAGRVSPLLALRAQ
jgi:predicted permease